MQYPSHRPLPPTKSGRRQRQATSIGSMSCFISSCFKFYNLTIIMLLLGQRIISARTATVEAFQKAISTSSAHLSSTSCTGPLDHRWPHRSQTPGLHRALRSKHAYQPLTRPRSVAFFATAANEDNNAVTFEQDEEDESMSHVYEAWTLEQDQQLWEQFAEKKKSVAELASILGRGLQGVKARLNKLNNVDSPAYQRLFQGSESGSTSSTATIKKEKLVPVSEVLRRIQWDHSLQMEDFRILHYDRVEDKVMESAMDAPNTSIQGAATSLIDALPEHRIVGVKYKERIVWDREERIDLVFDNKKGSGGGIYQIIEEYDAWKRQRDRAMEWNRKRQAQVSQNIEQILGFDRFAKLKGLSKDLQEEKQKVAESLKETQTINDSIEESSSLLLFSSTSLKRSVEQYVLASLQLFRDARNDESPTSISLVGIPATDFLACDCFSELVALLPDSELRPMILNELSLLMDRFEGKKNASAASSKPNKHQQLPELLEDDLNETFIRGSGPGGQKINKTSNRVLLIHEPTQLKVECQDTRSLQQNRKIARKKLRLKLDEYINGSSSRAQTKARKASTKRSKSKARNKARLERKRQAKLEKQQQHEQEDDTYSIGS